MLYNYYTLTGTNGGVITHSPKIIDLINFIEESNAGAKYYHILGYTQFWVVSIIEHGCPVVTFYIDKIQIQAEIVFN